MRLPLNVFCRAWLISTFFCRKRLEQSDLNGFGNEIYSVTFDSKERGQIFGAKYHFFLQDSVNCPEFLVNFPVLQKMAAKFKMKCVFRQTFQEFFDQYSNRPFYKKLLEKMDALEVSHFSACRSIGTCGAIWQVAHKLVDDDSETGTSYGQSSVQIKELYKMPRRP